jgi:hypothetical protein
MKQRFPLIVSGIVVVLILGLATPATSQKSSTVFTLLPAFWFAKMTKSDIHFRDSVGSGPVLGDHVDLVSDFGTSNGPKTMPGVRALLAYRGSLILRGGFQQLDFRGGTQTSEPIQFAGYTIPTGTAMDTSTRFDFFEVGLQYNLIHNEDIKLGIFAEPKFMNLRVRVSGSGQEGTTGPVVPFYEKEEEFVVMPLLGVHLQVRPLDWLGIRGELKGLAIPNADSLGLGAEGSLRAVDAEIMASFFLGDALAVSGGYRLFKFGLGLEGSNNRTVDMKMEFEGWMLGLDLRF